MIARADTLDGSSEQRENVNEPQATGYSMTDQVKLLRPFVAMVIPTLNGPWVAATVTTLVSVATMWVPVNQVLKFLALSIVVDLVTGFLCKRKGFDRPNISMTGGLVSAGCYSVAQYLAKQPELNWEIPLFNRTFGVGEFFALWWMVCHLSNITKNMDDLDAPLPGGVKSLIKWMRSFIDTAEIGGPIISVFKSSLKQTGGDVQVVSKTETTVTEKPKV